MMGIEWEIPRGLRSFFWVCYFHEVGLSRKKPGYSKVNIRIKKDLMKHGECVLHKVLISYFFLGSQTMPKFALLTGLEDAEVSPKQRDHSHSRLIILSMVFMGLFSLFILIFCA